MRHVRKGFTRMTGARGGRTVAAAMIAALTLGWSACSEGQGVSSASTDGGAAPPNRVRVASHPLADTLDDFVRRAMKAVDSRGGLAVAVVRDTQVVFLRGYGAADASSGESVDPASTAFYIASSTKSFTGMAAAMMASRGELDLDAPVAEYLPELRLPSERPASEVTLRELLTHTDGIENQPVVIRTAFTGEHDPRTLLEVLSRSTVVEDTAFDYSNLGYVITSMAMERVAGDDWRDVLAREVFTPLGMNRTTGYVSRARRQGWELAMPYEQLGEGLVEMPYYKSDQTMHAAGGLLTTASDLARWLEANLNGGRLDGRQVLPAAAVREAHRKQAELEASFYKFQRDGYGLGWYHSDYEGDLLMHHFGAFSTFRAHVSFMPEHGIGVAVVAAETPAGFGLADLVATFAYDRLLEKPELNARYDERVADFSDQITRRRAGRREHRAERAERSWQLTRAREAYVGTYVSPVLGTLAVTLDEGEFRVRIGEAESKTEPFEREDALRFEVAGNGAVANFHFDGAGPADSATVLGTTFRRVGEEGGDDGPAEATGADGRTDPGAGGGSPGEGSRGY